MKHTFLALFLTLFLAACSQELETSGSSRSSNGYSTVVSACNVFSVKATSTTFYIRNAKVRHPAIAEPGMTIQDQLLLKISSSDISGAWYNSAAPIRTQFFRQSGKTGVADSTPLSMSFYLKSRGVKLNASFNYFSNEALWALRTQESLNYTPSLEEVDVLINGTAANWEVLSVRFDQTQSGSTGVAHFLNVTPDFYADPNQYKATHPTHLFSLAQDMWAMHPEINATGTIDPVSDLATKCTF